MEYGRRAQASPDPPICRAYFKFRQIYDERNAVMHRGNEDFPRIRPATFESWVDEVVLAVARWSSLSGKRNRTELDLEIRALVTAGVAG